MSVTGFNIGGTIHKYDFNALDNKPVIPQGLTVDSELSSNSVNPVQNRVIKEALDGKAAAESGKGLSTEDFTTELKDKLNGIAAGAEVNVNADWNANSGDAQILNKPSIVSAELIASEFSTESDYSAGDYILYNNLLYKFVNDHSAGAWDSSDVEEETVVDELAKKPAYPYEVHMLMERGTLVSSSGAINNTRVYTSGSTSTSYIDICRRSRYMVKVESGATLKINTEWSVPHSISLYTYGPTAAFVTKVTYEGPYTVPNTVGYVKVTIASTDGVPTTEPALTFLSDKPLSIAKNPRIMTATDQSDPATLTGSEKFFFEVDPGIYTTARIALPPNYSVDKDPVPLFIHIHGAESFTTWSFNYPSRIANVDYLNKEGYAVLAVFPLTTKWESEWSNIISNTFPTPIAIRAYKAALQYALDRFNIDKNNINLFCKSLGGELAIHFANDPDMNLKSVCLLAPATDMLSTSKICYNEHNFAYVESELGLIDDGFLESYPSTNTAMGRKFIETNKYILAGFNPAWQYDGVSLDEKVARSENVFNGETQWPGGIARACCPVKAWVAPDDTAVSFDRIAVYIKQLKNGGVDAHLRIMPINTGGHFSVDSDPNAPRENITTKLGYYCEDIPSAWIEMVDFARGNRTNEQFFDRGNNAAPDSYAIKSAAGSIVKIVDGADMIPIKAMTVTLPYSETPYTSVTINRALTENEYAFSQISAYHSNSEVVSSLDNGTGFKVSCDTAATHRCAKRTTQLIGGHKIFISADVTINSGTANIAIFNGSTAVQNRTIRSNGYTVLTYDLPEDASDFSIRFYCTSWQNAETGDVEYRDVRIDYERGSVTALMNDVTVASDSTISDCYGGTLDAVSGVLTITKDENGDNLETPVIHQLLPVNLYTLRGENVIWSNSGSLNITYRADPTLYKPTPSDIGAVALNQGSGNANKFLVVGNDGIVTTLALSTWQGGNYGS